MGWVGKAGFFFGGLSVLCVVWTYSDYRRRGGRTYEELDILFQRKVPVRRFVGYHIDAFQIYNESKVDDGGHKKGKEEGSVYAERV